MTREVRKGFVVPEYPRATASAVKRQAAVLAYIDQYWHDHHYAPSLRDIVADCGISSTSVASYIVDKLEKAGHLTNQPGAARSIVPAWVHRALEDHRAS